MPPCGVPLLTFLVEWADPIVEYTTLLVSIAYEHISPTVGRSMPSSVRAQVIAVGVTLVRAPSMSRNAAREYSLFRKPFSILDTREWREYLLIYPYGTRAVRQRVGFGRWLA